MAETTLTVRNHSLTKLRIESTDIYGAGTSFSPILRLHFKMQLISIPAQPTPTNYTMVRLAGRVAIANPEEQLAVFESLPIAEVSNPQAFERQMQIDVPLGIRQVKKDRRRPWWKRSAFQNMAHVVDVC